MLFEKKELYVAVPLWMPAAGVAVPLWMTAAGVAVMLLWPNRCRRRSRR